MRPVEAGRVVQGGGAAARLPSRRRLEDGLAEALGETRVEVLSREPNVYTSTFPTETVTCRIGGSRTVSLFCKYGPTVYESGYGHRGGIAYEAAVYRDVLSRASTTVPRYIGEHAEDGVTWLFIEPIEPSVRVGTVPLEDGLVKAAAWLGRLHAQFEGERLDGVRTHDARYYAGWAQRTLRFAGRLWQRFPWLEPLCESYLELVPSFAARPRTLVHGEFTMDNILASRGSVYPVDWQSAAVGTGEEDLAMLIERWPQETAEACQQEYTRERWSGNPPEDARWALDMALLYTQLRWLGSRPDWTQAPGVAWRFDLLEENGARLNLPGTAKRPMGTPARATTSAHRAPYEADLHRPNKNGEKQ